MQKEEKKRYFLFLINLFFVSSKRKMILWLKLLSLDMCTCVCVCVKHWFKPVVGTQHVYMSWCFIQMHTRKSVQLSIFGWDETKIKPYSAVVAWGSSACLGAQHLQVTNRNAHLHICFLLLYIHKHIFMHVDIFLFAFAGKNINISYVAAFFFIFFFVQIYNRATLAYGALSARLGERSFFFENRSFPLLYTLEWLPFLKKIFLFWIS